MATKKKFARKQLTPTELAEEKALFAEQVVVGTVLAKVICIEVFGNEHTNVDAVLKIFGYLEFDDDGNPPEDTTELIAQLKAARDQAQEVYSSLPFTTMQVLELHENMHESFVSSDDLADLAKEDK